MERKLQPVTQSTDLASHERCFTASGLASIAMSEARRTQTPSPLPRAPIPRSQKRNFLLCKEEELFYFALTRKSQVKSHGRCSVAENHCSASPDIFNCLRH